MMTLFLPRLKKFEETHAKMSDDDLRNPSSKYIEFESEIKYPKASTATSSPFQGITAKTKLTGPKRSYDYFLKRYAHLIPNYLARSVKRKSMVSKHFQKFCISTSHYSFNI